MIELIGVSKKYGDKVIFDEYSLKIEEGEFVALVGESGCGKSTLLNIIGLIERYDKGYINIDGNDEISTNSVTATRLRRHEISYLFQNFALVENSTVRKNLEYVQKKARTDITIEEALEAVGLIKDIDTKVYKLSGGEQQRVALARLMFKKCDIILADEPTGSLDAGNAQIVLDFLHKLNNNGKTVILVTHDEKIINKEENVVNL